VSRRGIVPDDSAREPPLEGSIPINLARRKFIAALGSAAAVWPLTARSQQVSTQLIGLLHGGSPATRANLLAAFHDGLEKSGYVEGRNVAIEYRWADDHPDRIPALVADLVRRQVNVIAAVGGELCAFAAKAATSSVPIVFIAGDNPAKAGLVASLDRPGGNLTGVNMFTIELQAKRLGLLHEFSPSGLSYRSSY
jgi:putative ABC transport system substrate-binding protein